MPLAPWHLATGTWWYWVLLTLTLHHRVHHGSDAVYLDKNYAGIFVVWDRMFGTCQPELHRPAYGLTTPVTTHNLLTLQYGAYAQMFRDVRAAGRFRDELAHVLGPPGWHPAF